MRNGKLIAFATVAAVVASSAVAMAGTGKESIEVYYQNIKLVVNGVTVRTANEPFIYNGTTYLPVRAVAEVLGQDVKWDGQTNTVYLGRTPEGHYLSDVPPYHASTDVRSNNADAKEPFKDLPMTMGGTKYAKGLQIWAGLSFQRNQTDTVSWNLNGQYTSLTGLVGLDDNRNQYGPITIKIQGDDTELLAFTLTPGDLPKALDLNVKGVQRLNILITNKSGSGFPYGSMVDVVNLIAK